LTGAVVTGLDVSVLGEQTVVVRITVGATQYTGELVVNVVKNNTPLIIGLSAGITSVFAGVSGVIYFLVLKKKKL